MGDPQTAQGLADIFGMFIGSGSGVAGGGAIAYYVLKRMHSGASEGDYNISRALEDNQEVLKEIRQGQEEMNRLMAELASFLKGYFQGRA